MCAGLGRPQFSSYRPVVHRAGTSTGWENAVLQGGTGVSISSLPLRAPELSFPRPQLGAVWVSHPALGGAPLLLPPSVTFWSEMGGDLWLQWAVG